MATLWVAIPLPIIRLGTMLAAEVFGENVFRQRLRLWVNLRGSHGHLRHLLKRIEIVNLRQNTLFRILESLTRLQTDYLGTRREDRKRPISLRMLARRLQLAPSTVSRAVSGRSIRLPWGKEVPLITRMPGRRNVVREVLTRWLSEPGPRPTDIELAQRLRHEYGIQVSRRTVNAARHEVTRAVKP